MSSRGQRSFDAPRLAPLLPLIYVAWADGDLTETEMEELRRSAEGQAFLDEDARKQLNEWTDPDEPPSPAELRAVLRRIHEAANEADETERESLVGLGMALATRDRDSSEVDWIDSRTRTALENLERTLGVECGEAAAELMRVGPEQVPPPAVNPPDFDVEVMRKLLDGRFGEQRDAVRELLSQDAFSYAYNLTKEEQRERVLGWLHKLAEEGVGRLAYPGVTSDVENLGRFVATFETLAFFDLSLVVKFGVQFGLFGGTIYFLGTEKHHTKYLQRVADCDLLGCFAMTESGHGSNVRDLETTITYQPATDTFAVNTPSERARKEWIGNAADDGTVATVFGQLIVDGENHGVHAILVPIRTPEGDPLPDVRTSDCGHKMGLNGVDNGRLWFDNVVVPRENLLDRYGGVAEDGAYRSPIPGDTKRFFTTLGTLVGGRVSVAGAALSAAKSALSIAILYGAKRRQFGPAGGLETAILDYQTHQRRLMPLLARTFAFDFGLQYLTERYLNRTGEDAQEVEALAAGLKAGATWHATDTIQTSRECCGGNGYLSENRFASLKGDTDVFATFEGDNIVLLQLVAKSLLGEFRRQFGDERLFSMLRYIREQASSQLSRWNPLTTRTTSIEHLRDRDWQLEMFRYRERDLLTTLARRLKKRIDEGMDSFDAFTECQNHAVNLANAHVDRVLVEQFVSASEKADDSLMTTLDALCDLFALSTFEENRCWFLEEGYIAPVKGKAIRKEVTQLCKEVRAQAVHLVDAFGIPESCLAAPIALSDRGF
ncbi:MAG: acyl-CoA dehydrogenase [Candidatus Sulfomarinibacteraceae bacterium]